MQLVALPDGHLLDAPAAAALLRAIAAGCPVDITSAFRSEHEQLQLIALHKQDPTRYAYASPPDKSDHCKGRAIDTGNKAGTGAMQRWLIAHPDFGLIRTALPPEPWHFAYLEDHDEHQEDDDMSFNEDDRGALRVLFNHVNQAPAAMQFASQGDITIVLAQLAALNATVAELAKGQGADPDAIRQAAEDGANAALANLTLTIAPKE